VLTVDLHAGQIQGFFDIPTDNLFAAPVLIKDIKERFPGNNPPSSAGCRRRVRARAIAKRLDADLAIIDKPPRARRHFRGHEHHRRGRRHALHPGG